MPLHESKAGGLLQVLISMTRTRCSLSVLSELQTLEEPGVMLCSQAS